jgi:hypothetical protein
MLSSRIRLLASAGILCGALTAATVGGAFAAPASGPPTPNFATTTNVAPEAQATPTTGTAHAHRTKPSLMQGILTRVATLLGITPAALDHQIAQGQTIAQVAAANGKSATDVQSALMANLQGHLDKAVAAGKITSAKEAEILKNAPQHITKLLDANLTSALKRVTTYRYHVTTRPGQGSPTAPATSTP